MTEHDQQRGQHTLDEAVATAILRRLRRGPLSEVEAEALLRPEWGCRWYQWQRLRVRRPAALRVQITSGRRALVQRAMARLRRAGCIEVLYGRKPQRCYGLTPKGAP